MIKKYIPRPKSREELEKGQAERREASEARVYGYKNRLTEDETLMHDLAKEKLTLAGTLRGFEGVELNNKFVLQSGVEACVLLQKPRWDKETVGILESHWHHIKCAHLPSFELIREKIDAEIERADRLLGLSEPSIGP